jgi:hypothetical protein
MILGSPPEKPSHPPIDVVGVKKVREPPKLATASSTGKSEHDFKDTRLITIY